MFSLFKLWLLGSLFSIGLAQANEEVSLRLLEADSYRLQSASAKVVTEVSQFEKQQLKKQHRYNVYIRPERESLVVFKAQSELGQKMLMLGDNYWLLMPNSRRPIRITPMQKLLGEASVGDISTLTWSEDYQGELGEVSEIDGVNAQHLQLQAKTSGASYQKIDLWVDQNSNFPLKADLYLKSGKLAKQAYFEQGQRDGRTVVTTMTLVDSIQTNKSTVIDYQSVQAHSLADKYYNPAYLSKQSLEQL
ncbi:outer membrane lipoprotein-sorting protein [Agarivorans aestuarii]|uniref:Outer membrane lipoprotein-sorting protein n=1 Tax=Agarivorans aestuarii TaxID=1563703 RepID=A0ABU7G5F7_9ALTE|nr:outer membrane lipoprotein-sorting protein [Agarivorans aestuarii]MEE1673675.1 outer membrane lipoprotein-sorting protein [Agarivorans aestuarii]